MLVKVNNNKIILSLCITLILFLIIIYIFRVPTSNLIMSIYSNYLGVNNQIMIKADLNLSEREELEKLKIENSLLKEDIKDLKTEINLIEDGLEPTYVKMLSKSVSYYGSFYVTYPKDKTVYKGMNVYSHGNVLVGEVEEILSDSLFVTRLGQNKTFFAESQNVNEQIELSSLGGGLYVGKLVSGSKVSVGDNIILRGYPRSVVGTVSEILKNADSNSTLFVRTPYNVFEKEIFYVLQ